MKRLLVLVSPYGESMKRDVFEACAGMRNDFELTMLVPAADRSSFAPLGVQIETWSPTGVVGMYRAPRVLRRVVERYAPEAVHAHGFAGIAIAAATLPRTLAGRAVLSFHDDVRKAELPERYVRTRLGPLVMRAAARTCVAPSLAAYLAKQMQTDVDSFTVVPHGVQTATVAALDRPAGRPGPILGWFGRLGADLAWQTVIDTAVAVRSNAPAARLVVGGAGPSLSFVRSYGRSKLGEAFELSERAMSARDLFPAIDVLLVPVSNEAQPHGLLEALVWGVPVAGVNAGAVADALGEFATGWLTPGDPEGLAQGVLDAWSGIDRAWSGARDQRAAARDRYARETVDRAMLEVLGTAPVRDREEVHQRP